MVHVTYNDAAAYARWAGRELPTEAEWERAARGDLDGAEFAWGDELFPDGEYLANTWQGEFPIENSVDDGFEGTAPVGSFPANGFGLYDVIGNVWEWTVDWYTARHRAGDTCCAAIRNPRGGTQDDSYDPRTPDVRIPRKVMKGGFIPVRAQLLPALPARRRAWRKPSTRRPATSAFVAWCGRLRS